MRKQEGTRQRPQFEREGWRIFQKDPKAQCRESDETSKRKIKIKPNSKLLGVQKILQKEIVWGLIEKAVVINSGN